MKCYQHWSTEALIDKKKSHTGTTMVLEEDIEDWNRTLSATKSLLITMSLTHAIKKAKEQIHAIETELYYRDNH